MISRLIWCCTRTCTRALQALFKRGATTLEVTYYTNLYVFVLMTMMGGGSGHLVGAYNFILAKPHHGLMLVLYAVVAYWAINFHIRVVQRYGSVVAVLVGNMRKAGTITLSFMLFPKPFSWFYVWGTILVFGGLTVTAMIKDQRRRARDMQAKQETQLSNHAQPSTER